MVNKFKKVLIIFLLLLFTFLIGCSSKSKEENKNTPDNPSKELTEQDKFDQFLDEVFVDEVQTNTINLHYTLSDPDKYGITDYPITLGDFSKEYFENSAIELEDTLTKLKTFNYDHLSAKQQVTYDVLNDYVATELSYNDLYLYYEPLSSTLGDQAQLPILLAEYTFNNKTDVENYLTLLSQTDEYFSSLINFEKEKINAGLFMSDDVIDAVISQCSKFIENPDQNYLLDVFNERINQLSSLSKEDKKSYKEQNNKLILENVIPSYQYLIDELNKLRGNGKNSNGLYYLEHGKEYYEYLVQSNTGSSKSISQITSMVKAKIQSDLKEMNSLIINNPEIIDQLENYEIKETEPDKIISVLQKKMLNDFPKPPSVKYSFKYVHKSLEEDLSPAFYLIPPIDDYKNNVIYINGNDEYSSQDLFTTIAHEGYPGHLYQTTYYNSTNPEAIRSLLNYSGYIEGWATYTEILSYEYTDLDSNIAQLLALNTSYALGIYSRIDIGVNYEGWTLENVSEFLSDYGITDTSIAKEIFICMIESPGNYLNYYVGYLEILELKDIAQKTLGDNFSLKEFHKFFLDMGPAPFDVILKHMNSWISSY